MNSEHTVIITGTGRAGTTFLVQLLSELGLDTGYTPAEAVAAIDAGSHAGLEFDLTEYHRPRTVRDWWRQPKHTMGRVLRMTRRAPYVVKSPALCGDLERLLAIPSLVIDHVYIPVRELEQAALSRIRLGGAHGSVAGGLWNTGDPRQQKAVLAEMFFQLVYTLAVHDLPHTFLVFPRLVEDWAYAYDRLQLLVKEVEPGEFQAAFRRVADRRLVHRFDPGSAAKMPDRRQVVTGAPAAADRMAVPRKPGGGFWQRICEHWIRAGIWLGGWRFPDYCRLAAWISALSAMEIDLGGRAGLPPPSDPAPERLTASPAEYAQDPAPTAGPAVFAVDFPADAMDRGEPAPTE